MIYSTQLHPKMIFDKIDIKFDSLVQPLNQCNTYGLWYAENLKTQKNPTHSIWTWGRHQRYGPITIQSIFNTNLQNLVLWL